MGNELKFIQTGGDNEDLWNGKLHRKTWKHSEWGSTESRYVGLCVCEIPNPIEVKRTISERLFSWPWCPWIYNKEIHHPSWEKVHGGEFFIVGNTLYVSTSTYKINEHKFQDM